MRGLRHFFGCEVPSVRLRINDTDMPPGTYLIMLREIPLVMGTVDPSRGLCDATVERLASLHIEAERATNPANGNECSWVHEADWQKVKDAGFRIWSAKEYIVLHLSSVIRKNLAEFAGIQSVAQLLKDKDKERYSRILTAQGGLPRFTSVIQSLLVEEVPITALPQICDCYLESEHLPTHEIPEQIRCLEVVRKDIPGNAPDTPIYRLGDRFIALLAEGIRPDGEAAVLALKPEPTQEALSAVRTEVNKLPPTAKNPALFVEDWRMRAFVRKLVELSSRTCGSSAGAKPWPPTPGQSWPPLSYRRLTDLANAHDVRKTGRMDATLLTTEDTLRALDVPWSEDFARNADGIAGYDIVYHASRLFSAGMARDLWLLWNPQQAQRLEDSPFLECFRKFLTDGLELGYRLGRFREVSARLPHPDAGARNWIRFFEDTVGGHDCCTCRMFLSREQYQAFQASNQQRSEVETWDQMLSMMTDGLFYELGLVFARPPSRSTILCPRHGSAANGTIFACHRSAAWTIRAFSSTTPWSG